MEPRTNTRGQLKSAPAGCLGRRSVVALWSFRTCAVVDLFMFVNRHATCYSLISHMSASVQTKLVIDLWSFVAVKVKKLQLLWWVVYSA